MADKNITGTIVGLVVGLSALFILLLMGTMEYLRGPGYTKKCMREFGTNSSAAVRRIPANARSLGSRARLSTLPKLRSVGFTSTNSPSTPEPHREFEQHAAARTTGASAVQRGATLARSAAASTRAVAQERIAAALRRGAVLRRDAVERISALSADDARATDALTSVRRRTGRTLGHVRTSIERGATNIANYVRTKYEANRRKTSTATRDVPPGDGVSVEPVRHQTGTGSRLPAEPAKENRAPLVGPDSIVRDETKVIFSSHI